MMSMSEIQESVRRTLERKLGAALREDISILPSEMQQILIDDLVTAFIGRAKVMGAAAHKLPQYKTNAFKLHNLL